MPDANTPVPAPSYPVWAEPRDGVPWVCDSQRMLQRAAEALHAGTGPVAVDTERASGFRYDQRTFLLQLRREGSGTWLIDPEAFEDLDVLREALAGTEWILHSALQDLPGIHELGLWPDRLFDTELAARLAGFARVGLAAVVERTLGYTLAKEHSAQDWSVRPLPKDWLRYAALDVDVLIDIREELIRVLTEQGKLDFARQEFEAIRTAPLPAPKPDRWRRTSGIHSVRTPRRLAIVRSVWEARDRVAQAKDVSPHKVLPDRAIIAAATGIPRTVPQLLSTPGFHGRSVKKDPRRWLDAIQEGARDQDPPPLVRPPRGSIPAPNQWSERNPAAAARLDAGKAALAELSESWSIPAELLLLPASLRQLAWEPPTPTTAAALVEALRSYGARPWQTELAAPVLADAFAAITGGAGGAKGT